MCFPREWKTDRALGFRLLMGFGYELCYQRDFDAQWALLVRIFLMRYSYACELIFGHSTMFGWKIGYRGA